MSDKTTGSLGMVAGYRIIVDPNMTERVLHARSPARAKRRARLGHPQHHIIRPMRSALQMGDKLVMHPAMVDDLRKAIAERPPVTPQAPQPRESQPLVPLPLWLNDSLITMRPNMAAAILNMNGVV